MAAGNMVGGTASVAATSGTYDIKPGVGVEWVIHNITVANAVTISYTDGTNTITIDAPSGPNTYLGLTCHVSNTFWIRISNTGASAVLIAYDGMQTA